MQTPPPYEPKDKKDARNRLRLRALLVVAVVAAIGLFYWVVDPEKAGWVPQCVFKRLTGYDCMGCGSQRMVHALVHGHFAEAFRANALLFVSLPLLAFGVWMELNRERRPRLYARVFSPGSIIVAGVVLALWTVARNVWGF